MEENLKLEMLLAYNQLTQLNNKKDKNICKR
jgi:hypothetical protein